MNLEALATQAALGAGPGSVSLVRGGHLGVRRVTHDSRAVRAGDLFVALPGQRADGRLFIPQALAAGAVAVAGLAEILGDVPAGVGFLALGQPRVALGPLAAAALGCPARSLKLIGVTGTNGKTTTTTLLAGMCDAAGSPPGLVGTVEHRIGALRVPTVHTTPEAPELQALLADMRDADVRIAALEVSSIGLMEHRLGGLAFDVAAFLNLTPDHLDYHGTFSAYGDAKLALFRELLSPTAVAIVNLDDPFGSTVLSAVPPGRSPWRLSLDADAADITYLRLEQTPGGLRGRLRTPAGEIEVETSLVGAFNAQNVAVAVACALAVGLPASAIEAGLRAGSVKGRLERVAGPAVAPTVLVDYAHTPDALERALDALRPGLSGAGGRIIVVFGCGGDRDRTKRPLMGRAAAGADVVVVTTDNPRNEAPEDIAGAALAGALATGMPRTDGPEAGGASIVLDRQEAISRAVASASPADLVLIAGKGHETYQEILGRRLPFDDVDVARQALAARWGAQP